MGDGYILMSGEAEYCARRDVTDRCDEDEKNICHRIYLKAKYFSITAPNEK